MRSLGATVVFAASLVMAVSASDRGHAADAAPIGQSLVGAQPLVGSPASPVPSSLVPSSPVPASPVIDWRSPLQNASARLSGAFDVYAAFGAAGDQVGGSEGGEGSTAAPASGGARSAPGTGDSASRDAADLPILAAPERDTLTLACIGLVGAAWACRRGKRRDHGVEVAASPC